MKRRLLCATALLAALFFSTATEASKVKFKTSDAKSSELVEEDAAIETDEPLVEDEADVEEPSEAKSAPAADIKAPKDAEYPIPAPSVPVPLMTDEERDRKYPVVPEALEMTLAELVPTKELRDARVLKTMARIPRAEFVPKDYREYAYQDAAIPIGEAQTISPPFIVAYMTETLNPKPTDRVLEIGTGSGYQAAVLSCLVAEVYSIEIVKPLGRKAAETIKKLRYDNVFIKIGDGYQGWPEAAPFDKIIVTCSPEDIPQPLIDQLKDGGKMLIPIGERYLQYFVLCEKKGGELVKTTLTPANFVPMTGEAESLRRELPDPTSPSLIGGGFETVNPIPGASSSNAPNSSSTDEAGTAKESDSLPAEIAPRVPARRPTPEGWFSTRNIYVADRADAYEGARVCVCDNASVREEQGKKERVAARVSAATLPENRREVTESDAKLRERQRDEEAICHLRQNFAVDGTKVKRLVLSGAYRTDGLRSDVENRRSISLIRLFFFDKDRKPIRHNEIVVLTTDGGNCPWTEFSREIQVPARAVEGSLQVGILDGTGVVEFDGFELRNKNEKSARASKRR